MTIADVLRHFRTRAGFSLEGLAELTGLTPAGISKIELGQRAPKRETVLALATGLDLSPAETDLLLHAAGFSPVSLGSLMTEPALAELDDLIAAAPQPVADDIRAKIAEAISYGRDALAGAAS